MTLRRHQIARADGQNFLAVAQERASLLIDSDPASGRGAVADDAGDSIARLVNGMRAPFLENSVAIERRAQPPIEVLDERLGRRRDSVADDQERSIVLDARFDQDARHSFSTHHAAVLALHYDIDRKYFK